MLILLWIHPNSAVSDTVAARKECIKPGEGAHWKVERGDFIHPSTRLAEFACYDMVASNSYLVL